MCLFCNLTKFLWYNHLRTFYVARSSLNRPASTVDSIKPSPKSNLHENVETFFCALQICVLLHNSKGLNLHKVETKTHRAAAPFNHRVVITLSVATASPRFNHKNTSFMKLCCQNKKKFTATCLQYVHDVWIYILIPLILHSQSNLKKRTHDIWEFF